MIVTGEQDTDSLVVAEALRRRGHEPVLLHPQDIPLKSGLTTRISQSGTTADLRVATGTVDLKGVRAVWWAKPAPPQIGSAVDARQQEYARAETGAALAGVWKVMASDPDVYWINRPDLNARAGSKVEQARRAAAAGFRTPATLVSNDPQAVLDFYDEHNGDIIFKTMSGPFLQNSDWMPLAPGERPVGMYTVRLGPENLEHIDDVLTVPCLFQEYVPKAVELRITVFDDQVFTCVLHSQDNPDTATDWRRVRPSSDFRRSVGRLPDDLAKRCVEFVHSYGLHYGAFDFIVTPDGEHVFLEMNPGGLWMFVQQWLPELPMLKALTDLLVLHA